MLCFFQVTSDEVRVTVSHATIDDADILNNDSIKMLYIEYSFLGVPLEETETPFTLPKMAGKPMNYNFSKGFGIGFFPLVSITFSVLL